MSILTAVDGEHVPSRQIEVGYELARQFGEELVVVHVMSDELFDEIQDARTGRNSSIADALRPESSVLASGVSYNPRRQSDSSEDPIQYSMEDGVNDAANVAQEIVAGTLDEWDDVTFQGRVGDPVEEIIAEIERRDPRYLIVGGRKRTPVGKALFGSTTQALLLNADIPVMTVIRQE